MWLSMVLQLGNALSPAPRADDFDLRTVARARCGGTIANDEIVVCACRRDDDRYRLRALPPSRYDTGPDEAAMQIGNAKVGVVAQKVDLPGGVTSNRALITLKIPF